jgi:hypothetical protein
MLSNTRNAAGVSPNVVLAALFAIVGLAACGSGGSTSTNATSTPPGTTTPTTTTVTASATPAQVVYNGTAVITWSSTDSTSCSFPPVGVTGTAGSYTTPVLTATTTYIITCDGPTGPASKSVTVTVASSSIAAAAAACAAEPMRGTVYYYCDCAAGASSGCVAGDDANAGTSPSAPRRTLANATARISSFTGNTNHTIALCKGGAFDSVAAYGETINRSGCTAGTDCDDIREYSPTTFAGTTAPILNATVSGEPLFRFSGNYGGVRILNLALQDKTTGRDEALWAGYDAHDITVCNTTMNDFAIAINLAGNMTVAPSTNVHIRGNTITNSSVIGFLGAASNSEINYNYWEGNGSSNSLDHTIYLSAAEGVTNMQLVGNYIHGQYGPTCLGVVLVAHGAFDYLNITDNTIAIDSGKSSGGCFGLGLGAAGSYAEPNYFRHTVVARNVIKNGGNLAMSIGNANGAVIEDNLIINDWPYQYTITGISVAGGPSRTSPADDIGTADIVRNNTVWFGPAVVNGGRGISTGVEGTGHIIANNTVVYTASSTGGRGFSCYDYTLSLSAYSFLNNNHCYSAATYTWNTSNGATLSAWKTYAKNQGWDSESIVGPPNFVNATSSAGHDFHPNTGSPLSPLLGAGSHANAPLYDRTGSTAFSNPPAIGAYE